MAVLTPKSQHRVSAAGNTLISRRPTLIKSALGALVAGLVLAAGQAKALVVNVGGQDYDVTVFVGSYNDNVGKFNTLENAGLMPWFNNWALASSFASAVSVSLGFLTDYPGQTSPLWGGVLSLPSGYVLTPVQGAIGPLFGYYHGGCDPGLCGTAYVGQIGHPFYGQSAVFGKNDSWAWAQATLVAGGGTSGGGGTGGTASVPGPLPALGLAAAFGFSRKLRKRIKLHNSTSAVSTSPGA